VLPCMSLLLARHCEGERDPSLALHAQLFAPLRVTNIRRSARSLIRRLIIDRSGKGPAVSIASAVETRSVNGVALQCSRNGAILACSLRGMGRVHLGSGAPAAKLMQGRPHSTRSLIGPREHHRRHMQLRPSDEKETQNKRPNTAPNVSNRIALQRRLSLARGGRPAPARSRCGEIEKGLGRESDRLGAASRNRRQPCSSLRVFCGTVGIVLCCRHHELGPLCHQLCRMDRRFATILSMSWWRPGSPSVGAFVRRKVAVGRSEKSRRLIRTRASASIASLRQSGRQARLAGFVPSKKFRLSGGGGIITVRRAIKARGKAGFC